MYLKPIFKCFIIYFGLFLLIGYCKVIQKCISSNLEFTLLIVVAVIAFILWISLGFNKATLIDKKLNSELPLSHQLRNISIDRPHELASITKTFILEETLTQFGVILGPSGTGKTYLTRLACSMASKGVVYYHIGDTASIPVQLARTIGMRLKTDATVIDSILEKLGFNEYVRFYTLPDDLLSGLAYVLDVLAERAAAFYKENGKYVTLFIDGVDLLAKRNPKAFIQLVDQAKHCAVSQTLRIVLVSSEGHVMPLLDKTSSTTRMEKVIEILDISWNNSVYYMTQHGIPINVTECVYMLAGGRFVHLDNSIDIYKRFQEMNLSDNDTCSQIKTELLARYYDKAIIGMLASFPSHGKTIMKEVLSAKDDILKPPEYLESVEDEEVDHVWKTFIGLTELNLLRFNSMGYVTWHSSVVKYGATQKYS